MLVYEYFFGLNPVKFSQFSFLLYGITLSIKYLIKRFRLMLSPLRKASKSNVNGPIDRYMTHYALYPRFISWCRFRCALWTEQIGVASVLPAYHCVRKSTGKANREVTWLIQAIWNKSCLKTHTRFSSEYHTLAVCNNFEGKMYLPTIFQSNVEGTLCSPHENSQKCSCL